MTDPLEQFCTPRQLEILNAYRKYGSNQKAATALGCGKTTICEGLVAIKRKAAKNLISTHSDPEVIPAGFAIKGTTTLRKNSAGDLQWVKTDRDLEQQQAILEQFALTLAEGVKGLAKATPKPKYTNSDILCAYPLGDPHFGMYAWWKETGADFDVAIAEKLIRGAIDRLVSSAPAAATAVLLNLGDMFHADNQLNTTKSGHQLDVDGRWAKVQQAGLMCMIYCVGRMLEKHNTVVVRFNKGNHDGNSSYALALMVSCYYHNEPRVIVDLSPAVCWYYRFGKVLLASTHGDTIKGTALVGLMAADRPEDWGATLYRYWYVGHIHHQDIKEYPGGIVEYLRTLAAKDAWNTGQGYRSGRDMLMIVHHKDFGEIERHRCDISMLE